MGKGEDSGLKGCICPRLTKQSISSEIDLVACIVVAPIQSAGSGMDPDMYPVAGQSVTCCASGVVRGQSRCGAGRLT